ncbi:OmpA family protein [Thiothrix lacustris]|uniref:OmpA family protein n=1 Tax=Thiothrix lacustris TaxID=525917 RepID=A0ABY9MU76_9GAMM|nr:OmpA family protein [Thiothrix lacustris]WML92215.1 OmpA family protein [Thiothrix lacustris]
MYKLITGLTMLSALSAAYAETPQFPDPSVIPPDTNTSSDGVTTTQQQTYTYAQPTVNNTTTTTGNSTGNTTGNSAAGIYVYPQADTSPITTTSTAVNPTSTYRYPPTQAATTYYTQPYTTGIQQPYYYNPSQYFLPGSMMTPPSVPPMMMPSVPNFNWPNMGYGYRNGNYNYQTSNTANAQTSTPQNTQQIDTLNNNLSSLRQQQTALESKAQETLALQEKTIAELRKQLEDSSKGKGDLESQLNALKGELAESVKKAELDSCKAEKGELESKVNAMDQKVSAVTEVSQQFAQLRENFASLEAEKQRLAEEKQQLANTLKNEIKDSDTDGIPDKLDKCLDSAAGVSVDATGCEPPKDGDKDGIADTDDLCPNTAANTEVNQVGCAKTENINLNGVTFETGSAVLTTDSLPLLDEAAITLIKHPDLTIEVGGHTDSSGDKTTNEKLSQSRAEAVMKYLVEKGAKAELLSAKGYGPSIPIADNTTPDGKAKNRRVELKILEQ